MVLHKSETFVHSGLNEVALTEEVGFDSSVNLEEPHTIFVDTDRPNAENMNRDERAEYETQTWPFEGSNQVRKESDQAIEQYGMQLKLLEAQNRRRLEDAGKEDANLNTEFLKLKQEEISLEGPPGEPFRETFSLFRDTVPLEDPFLFLPMEDFLTDWQFLYAFQQTMVVLQERMFQCLERTPENKCDPNQLKARLVYEKEWNGLVTSNSQRLAVLQERRPSALKAWSELALSNRERLVALLERTPSALEDWNQRAQPGPLCIRDLRSHYRAELYISEQIHKKRAYLASKIFEEESTEECRPWDQVSDMTEYDGRGDLPWILPEFSFQIEARERKEAFLKEQILKERELIKNRATYVKQMSSPENLGLPEINPPMISDEAQPRVSENLVRDHAQEWPSVTPYDIRRQLELLEAHYQLCLEMRRQEEINSNAVGLQGTGIQRNLTGSGVFDVSTLELKAKKPLRMGLEKKRRHIVDNQKGDDYCVQTPREQMALIQKNKKVTRSRRSKIRRRTNSLTVKLEHPQSDPESPIEPRMLTEMDHLEQHLTTRGIYRENREFDGARLDHHPSYSLADYQSQLTVMELSHQKQKLEDHLSKRHRSYMEQQDTGRNSPETDSQFGDDIWTPTSSRAGSELPQPPPGPIPTDERQLRRSQSPIPFEVPNTVEDLNRAIKSIDEDRARAMSSIPEYHDIYDTESSGFALDYGFRVMILEHQHKRKMLTNRLEALTLNNKTKETPDTEAEGCTMERTSVAIYLESEPNEDGFMNPLVFRGPAPP